MMPKMQSKWTKGHQQNSTCQVYLTTAKKLRGKKNQINKKLALDNSTEYAFLQREKGESKSCV